MSCLATVHPRLDHYKQLTKKETEEMLMYWLVVALILIGICVSVNAWGSFTKTVVGWISAAAVAFILVGIILYVANLDWDGGARATTIPNLTTQNEARNQFRVSVLASGLDSRTKGKLLKLAPPLNSAADLTAEDALFAVSQHALTNALRSRDFDKQISLAEAGLPEVKFVHQIYGASRDYYRERLIAETLDSASTMEASWIEGAPFEVRRDTTVTNRVWFEIVLPVPSEEELAGDPTLAVLEAPIALMQIVNYTIPRDKNDKLCYPSAFDFKVRVRIFEEDGTTPVPNNTTTYVGLVNQAEADAGKLSLVVGEESPVLNTVNTDPNLYVFVLNTTDRPLTYEVTVQPTTYLKLTIK